MSKKSLIDSIEVKNACSEKWNEMKGTDKVRFCNHCDFNVNNISELTRKQAMRFVRQSDGRICVRYVTNPVTKKPIFADKLYQISRRAGITAGVLGASLAFSTMTFAQGNLNSNVINSEVQTEQILKEKDADKDKFDGTAITFSGTITDSQGAVIPNANVTMTNVITNESRTAPTNDDGVYQFENVTAGRYKIQAVFAGFKESFVETDVYNGEESGANLTLEVQEFVTMGMIALRPYRTGLPQAVSNADLEEVKNLITRGENVNLKDENYGNITPLFLAVENGNDEITETLLNFGAKINLRDVSRQTPLMRVDEDASPGLVNLLIRHGAKVNLIDNDKNNALILASRAVKPEVLQILINHTTNINAQNSENRTALMEAADADNLENVRTLLQSGANVNLKNKDGESAIDLTTDEEIVKLLADYGAVLKEN